MHVALVYGGNSTSQGLLEGVLGDEVDVSQPLFGDGVAVFVYLLHDLSQVHRLQDDVIVVRYLATKKRGNNKDTDTHKHTLMLLRSAYEPRP